jgi:hypothetical protein
LIPTIFSNIKIEINSQVISERLEITNIVKETEKYILQWRNHSERMKDTRHSKRILTLNSKMYEKFEDQKILSFGNGRSGLILGIVRS